MLRRFFYALSVIGFVAAAAFVVTPVTAQAQEKAAEKASAFTAAQKAELHAIMKQFILDNPQALITSVETYYNKQNDTKVAQEGRVDQLPAGLHDDPLSPYAGDKNAKFVVVEFFDYNCGYCKQVQGDFQRLIDEDKTIKYVFKELPILSEMSEVAARHALAANMQGKYLPFHQALMQHRGALDMGVIEQAAKDVGLDVDKLKKDADTQEVRDALNKNIELARQLGIRGTPFFLFGKEKVPGAIGYTRMKEIILKERDGIAVPTAPSDGDKAAAPLPPSAFNSDTPVAQDPDVKAAIEDAKKETNELLRDIQKQAQEMKEAAEKAGAAAEKAAADKAAADKAAAPVKK